MPRNHTLRMGDFRKEGRMIVAPLVLLAFLLQIIAVQTHIHFPLPEAPVLGHTIASAPAAALHSAKKSGDTGTAHCPWCQVVLASGNYLSPAALLVALPAAAGFPDLIIQPAPIAASATSHAWRSRAPPA
jgi:hypothetical protein